MKKRRVPKPPNPRSKRFLSSYQWKAHRVKMLNRDGCRCALCGGGTRLTVHHILQRSTWPEYALEDWNTICCCAKCHSRFKKKFAAHGDPVAFWLALESLRPDIC